MAGNVEGGIKAAISNKSKYGADFYQRIGALGGKVKVPKGFALMNKEKVAQAGRKGGTISKRVKHDEYEVY